MLLLITNYPISRHALRYAAMLLRFDADITLMLILCDAATLSALAAAAADAAAGYTSIRHA